MKVLFPFLILLVSWSTPLIAQTSTLLSGTPIGSTSVDYSTNNPSQTVNIPANVFDGNFSTFYASYDRSNTYVGLDLGVSHVITRIGYSPRISYGSRVCLGIFQGANQPDFGDAVSLYIIPNNSTDNSMTYTNVSCTRGFRYIRYVSPNDARCNISELAFYGYQSAGSNTQLTQLTNLPTVSIQTVNNQDITSRDEYIQGIITIVSNSGQKVFSDSLSIRGRGNASWSFPKKPYRIKLKSKAQLLGFPAKAKNWTLINNYGDKTLMRNLLAFDVSRRLDMPYTPAGKPVDLVINGEYKGTYQLCDQIEVDSKRVDIESMEASDVTLPQLSGGYLVEIDAYADQEVSKFYSSQYRIPVTIKYPKEDDIVPAQSNYIATSFNNLESLLFGSNFSNLQTGFRQRLDISTFLKHFLVGEFAGNTDTYWSVYMYKKRNNDLFYTGPVWDFDLAYENDNRTYPINHLSDYIYRTNGSCATGMRNFVDRVLSDPAMALELSTEWSRARIWGGLQVDTLWAVVDAYAAEMEASQQLNFKRWDIMNSWVHQNPRLLGSYAAEVNGVKTYIAERLNWMDQKVGLIQVPNDLSTVSIPAFYVEPGQLIVGDGSVGKILTVYTLLGQRLTQLTISADYQHFVLPSGIYIVTLSDNNRNVPVQSFKIVVP